VSSSNLELFSESLTGPLNKPQIKADIMHILFSWVNLEYVITETRQILFSRSSLATDCRSWDIYACHKHLGPQCVDVHFPEGTVNAVLFRAVVFISYWNLIKINFKKTVFSFCWSHLKGPYFLNWNVYIHRAPKPVMDQLVEVPNMIKIRPTNQVLLRGICACAHTYHTYIHTCLHT
jgi:hypothetical protein